MLILLKPGFYHDYQRNLNERVETISVHDCLQLSFDCVAGTGGALLPRRLVHDSAGNAFLPWCGLLVNAATLEIQVTVQQWTINRNSRFLCWAAA